MRIYYLSSIVFVILFSIPALAQVQSHPLSQISGPFDVNLNTSGVNITNVSYVFFGNGSTDTYLYRSGTNTLQTASNLVTTGGWVNSTSVNVSNQLCLGGVCNIAWPSAGVGWTASGANLYNNTQSVHVGIGTSLPNATLHVVGGSINVTNGNVTITGTNAGIVFPDGTFSTGTDTNVSQLYGYNGTNWLGLNVTNDGILRLSVPAANTSYGWILSGSSLYTNASGVHVGIGTSLPNATLHVVGGSINVTNGNVTITGTNAGVVFPDGSFATGPDTNISQLYGYNGSWLGLNVTNDGILRLAVAQTTTPGWVLSGGNLYNSTATAVGIGTSSPAGLFDVNGLLTVLSSGKVGIGTTSPQQKLDVVGNINATGAVISGNNNVSIGGPNLVLNSDFGRRNKWMTFMPDTFTDTSNGITVLVGSSNQSVSSNIMTPGATDGTRWLAQEGLTTWKDARFSGQIKWNSGLVGIGKTADVNNMVIAAIEATQFSIWKRVGGTFTNIANTTISPIAGNTYWVELESQGTTYIAKFYSTGGTTYVAKSSATLQNTITATVTDAGVASGGFGYWEQRTGQATVNLFGGLSTGDGGVYVEGWGPESWTVYFNNTLGGQAVSFNETADSGPIGKQWTFSATIPAANRTITLKQDSPDGSISPSIPYTYSSYWTTGNKGGSGDLVVFQALYRNSTLSDMTNSTTIRDAGETSWTRAGVTTTTGANVRRVTERIYINQNATATGNVSIDLLQLDQGSIVTPWRNAPADDGGQFFLLYPSRTEEQTYSTTSTSFVEVDSRDLAANIFAPKDSTLIVDFHGAAEHDTAGGVIQFDIYVDGTRISTTANNNIITDTAASANVQYQEAGRAMTTVAAGKHRVAVLWKANAGTVKLPYNPDPTLSVLMLTGK